VNDLERFLLSSSNQRYLHMVTRQRLVELFLLAIVTMVPIEIGAYAPLRMHPYPELTLNNVSRRHVVAFLRLIAQ
jgi:hypothetical protein